MKAIAAYALLLLGGNASPSAEDVTALITAAGGEADAENVATLLGDLEGKDIHELLAKGEKDLKSCVAAGPATGAAPAAAAAAGAAAPKEAEKPKVEEVDALDGGMDMFGGGGGGGGDY
ncbi:50S ribosomal protein P1 [archaeon]|nr:MAG: 50S ribosomal protein P1 [archaeon]